MSREYSSHGDLAIEGHPAAIAVALAGIFALVAAPAALFASSDATFQAAVISVLLASALIVLSTIDIVTFQLPDRLTLPLAAVGILMHAPQGPHQLLQSTLAAILAYAVMAGLGAAYCGLRGRTGLGLGDAKLMAAAGAWLGVLALPSVVAFASVAALACVGIAAVRRGGVAFQARLPFGPFLAFAFWLVWLYGPLGIEPN